jgi:hypothetical protein
VRFELDVEFFESTCRIACRSATVDLHVAGVGLVLSVFTVEFFTGLEIVFRHRLSSHEHTALSNGFFTSPRYADTAVTLSRLGCTLPISTMMAK